MKPANRRYLLGRMLGVLFGLLLAGSALAESYKIDWYTIDGGGGVSSGGSYTVAGTIGQPDAGFMSGGTFSLAGGFWSDTTVVVLPELKIRLNGDGSVTVEWTGTGTLQIAPTVIGGWTDMPALTSPYTFTPTEPAAFLRLKQ